MVGKKRKNELNFDGLKVQQVRPLQSPITSRRVALCSIRRTRNYHGSCNKEEAVLLYSPVRPQRRSRAFESNSTRANLDRIGFTALYTATFSKPVVVDSYTMRREGQKSKTGRRHCVCVRGECVAFARCFLLLRSLYGQLIKGVYSS